MLRILLISLLLASGQPQGVPPEVTQEANAHGWLWHWMEAWTVVSSEIYHLSAAEPPQMVFFDEQYIYTNSEVSAPEGAAFDGPPLYNQPIAWRKQAHQDTLILPNGERTPVQLMTFAAPLEEGSFFVMAAPDFWKTVGLRSELVTFEQMLTGIFVHEFTHTRQIDFLGKKITEFAETGPYDYPVNDDIIQNYFSADSAYTRDFDREVGCLFQAATLADRDQVRKQVPDCLAQVRARQQHYLPTVNEALIAMDDIFLTMEGIGQFAMLSWFRHSQGPHLEMKEAIAATRHNRKWWSQEEGLALVLLYSRLAEKIDWTAFLQDEHDTVLDRIEAEING